MARLADVAAVGAVSRRGGVHAFGGVELADAHSNSARSRVCGPSDRGLGRPYSAATARLCRGVHRRSA
eukprot:7775114-Pyramimonas_sp.AAC.2